MKKKVLFKTCVCIVFHVVFFFFLSGCDGESNNKDWISNFDDCINTLSKEYAFTEWKGIDWDEIYSKYAPLIRLAQNNNNTEDYYLTMRQVSYSLPDGHVGISNDNMGLKKKYVGGSYGLAITELDNGSVIATIILPNSSADLAGIKFGFEILEWKGLKVQDALKQTSILWADNPSATTEDKSFQQQRFLVRDSIGSKAEITYRNNETLEEETVILEAIDDNYETLKLTNCSFNFTGPYTKTIESKTLSGNYGYIKINVLEPLENGKLVPDVQKGIQSIKDQFKKAIQMFIDQDVLGLIVDIRGNDGGEDSLAAYIAGFFFAQQSFYEYVSIYDKESGLFEIKDTIYIDPRTPYFSNPVIVMVSPCAMSSAEGIAMGIQRSHGKVISFYASNGSFGVTGGKVELIDGYTIVFPFGRSLNSEKMVQIDSKKNGIGGVIPYKRVPKTYDTMYEKYVEGEDIELNFVLEYLKNNT